MNVRIARALLAGALAMGLVACGDDDSSSEDTTDTTAATETSDTGSEETPEERGTIALVMAGDRSDGGYYQGQVEALEAAGEEHGYEVIVVDKVNPGAAQEAFENVARQQPDLIIAASELGPGLIPVAESPEFSDIDFLMITGAPPQSDAYATVGANENHAHLMGGVAAGLVLEREGKTKACIVAGPELPFVQNAEGSMRSGLALVDESFELLVTYTGSFEDAALAQEAASSLAANGCAVMYPYLGGALSAAVRAANDAGVPAAATSIDRCGDDSADIAMSILYNPSLFLSEVVAAYAAGDFTEGESIALYGVADGVGVGAIVCDATDEEIAELEAVAERLAAGELDDLLGA